MCVVHACVLCVVACAVSVFVCVCVLSPDLLWTSLHPSQVGRRPTGGLVTQEAVNTGEVFITALCHVLALFFHPEKGSSQISCSRRSFQSLSTLTRGTRKNLRSCDRSKSSARVRRFRGYPTEPPGQPPPYGMRKNS